MESIDSIFGFLMYVYSNHESIKDNEINLIYEGIITHDITKAFASLTEEKMEKEEESDSVQRKVFHVMVECLQNISKHGMASGNSAEAKKRGIILVAKNADRYRIVTGNHIENDKINDLKTFLEDLNKLEKEELTKLYKTKIKNNTLSEKGGAGLGFIDISRKTGEKLIFDFVPINEKLSFFIVVSTIMRSSVS